MSVGTASRLDKLLNLIEGGATSEICKVAAQQVASTAKSHPQQLPSLLQKVQPLLLHPRWEARSAASKCIGLMAQQAQHPTVSQLQEAAISAGSHPAVHDEVKGKAQGSGDGPEEDQLALEGLAMEQVLQNGTPLLASGGQEYDDDAADAALLPSQRLAKQRKSLKRRLGLEAGMDQLMDTEDLIKDEDLVTSGSCKGQPGQHGQKDAASLISDMTGLSARERNQLKRELKRKSSLKPSLSSKRSRSAAPAASLQNLPAEDPVEATRAAGAVWDAIQAGSWPFQALCNSLCADLLSARWESRHGAATALREVLRTHASSAAVQAPLSAEPSGWMIPGGAGAPPLTSVARQDAVHAAKANTAWLEDCSVRLLCVLALDRFGDYVSDKVVAPVREAAGQALGAAARGLPASSLHVLARHLTALVAQAEWGVRLAGLLGIKYVLAARLDQAGALLPAVLPSVLTGLKDREDDVRAVSAEALLPVVSLISQQETEAASDVESALWDSLLDVDDLSVSTEARYHSTDKQLLHDKNACAASAMQLLAQLHPLLPQPSNSSLLHLRQLWPFLRHNLDSVRLASVNLYIGLVASSGNTGSLQSGSTAAIWNHDLLKEALLVTFQSLLLEDSPTLLEKFKEAWRTLVITITSSELQQALTVELLDVFFKLAGTPACQSLEDSLIFRADFNDQKGAGLAAKVRSAAKHANGSSSPSSLYIGGLANGSNASTARRAAGEALAIAALQIQGDTNPVIQALMRRLDMPKASLRVLCGFMAMHMAIEARSGRAAAQPAQQAVTEKLLQVLAQPVCSITEAGASTYQEAQPYQAELRLQARAFLRTLRLAGFSLDGILNGMPEDQYVLVLTTETSVGLAAVVTPEVAGANSSLAAAQHKLQASCAALASVEGFLHGSVSAALAAAVVQCGHVPPKLNTVIQPLMAGLRREADAIVRDAVAAAVAQLVALCADRTPSPNDRIVKNLSTMACGDRAQQLSRQDAEQDDTAQQAPAEELPASQSAERIARQGAEAALVALVKYFGPSLITKLPRLWERMSSLLLECPADQASSEAPTQATADAQALWECLQILKTTGPALHASLAPDILSLLPGLVACCCHEHRGIHQAAASCAGALASSKPGAVLPELLRNLLPCLSAALAAAKAGALQMLQRLLDRLGMGMVPYLNLVVVPLMGLTSDPLPDVRAAATSAFAGAVALLPLAQGIAPPDGLDKQQKCAWHKDSIFLSQLLDNTKVDEFELPMEIHGELRLYQRAGVSWLAFLCRCGLHGVLADEMGLGKTLQATAIVVSSHLERRAQQLLHMASLIVCPPTLVAHWPHEIRKFVGSGQVSIVQYEGSPAARQALLKSAATADIVVMSYETIRADIEWISQRQWLYCVLDEGHIIRNPKAKITQAVKRINAQHRLILSGTPIQNNVLELWALFDFLMPGFLGTHAAFSARYGKALAAAKGSRTGSPEAQAGLLAMESLHKQVMPFVLRRTKDQVLKDLPPKIIQDVYVEPSALQRQLYEDFSATPASQQAAGAVSGDISAVSAASKAPHVFQALQYLRKLCSHPLLVLDASVPQHAAAVAKAGLPQGAPDWACRGSPLRALQHAPKLQALAQLLQECGIMPDASTPEVKAEEAEAPCEHRVLIFAQLKSYLDIVESDVLTPAGISYLRLDGSVEASARFSIVQRFNADPSIPVLLLTTHVGGLGLNLTAADTVIFLEHDWNPMKDLQAMDRAHRLGQKRAVNVYRLLTRGTLEERIMGLQRFKLDVANAVVNTDNASLASMDTSQILDLFRPPSESGKQPAAAPMPGAAAASAAAGTGKAGDKAGLKAVLDSIGELWDEQQYAEDFSLDAFMSTLK